MVNGWLKMKSLENGLSLWWRAPHQARQRRDHNNSGYQGERFLVADEPKKGSKGYASREEALAAAIK
jgi:hypothetical protein